MAEVTQCVFCKKENYIKLYKTYDIKDIFYDICKCKSCKAIFLNPVPNALQLADYYKSEYYGNNNDKFNPYIEYFLNIFRLQRAKRLAKLIPKNSKILDIGCGNGNFLHQLSNYGDYELNATELTEYPAVRAMKHKEIKLKIGDILDIDYNESYFDAVTLFHVFEHLTEPELTLQKVGKILKPGGILVLSFPNISSWQSKIFKGKWLHLDPPRHLFFFSPDDLEKVMKNYGFITIKAHYFSPEQNPYGNIQSILNIFHKKRDVLFENLKGNKNTANNKILLIEKIYFIISMPFFVITDLFSSLFKKSATVEMYLKKNKL